MRPIGCPKLGPILRATARLHSPSTSASHLHSQPQPSPPTPLPKYEWQAKVAQWLSTEMKREHRRFANEKKKKKAEHIVICHIRDEKIVQLLGFVAKLGRSKEVQMDEIDFSEVFAAALKHTGRYLATKDQIFVQNDPKAVPVLHNLLEALHSIPMRADDNITGVAYCMLQLERLGLHREIREELEEQMRKVYPELRRKLTMTTSATLPKQNRIFFNDADFGQIADFIQTGFDRQPPPTTTSPGLDYDQTPLVQGLKQPVHSNEYRGSPFTAPIATDYLDSFRQLLRQEQQYSVAVENFARNSVEKPMEALLDEWEWKEAIQSVFSRMRQDVSQVNVKLFIAGLDAAKVADALMEGVTAALCQGQSILHIPELESSLAQSLLNLAHVEFVNSVLSESGQAFEEVFLEFVRYFQEDQLARQYTLREWWRISAEKCRVNPYFHIPLGSTSKTSTEELGAFLLSVVMKACYIPDEKFRKRSRKGTTKAFVFRNVNIEERSPLLADLHKIHVNKMVELHPHLMHLIDLHQFRQLRFPFHALPTTLPPRPWMEAGRCGPHYTTPSDVLRNLFDFRDTNVNVEMRKRLVTSSQAAPVFDALNDLGSTPWVMNKPMLKELVHAFDLSTQPDHKQMLAALAIPMHPSTVRVPTFEEEFGVSRKVAEIPTVDWINFSKREHLAVKERNETNSLWYWLMYRLVLARHFRDQVLYFPHNMDFRGRVYPISPHLNHMGDDINRSLLKFARAKPLGKSGFDWLKLHCINLTGLLKRRSTTERLQFAEENLHLIVDSAENPWHGHKWWQQSEEPWQTLAACMEIRDVLESGTPREAQLSQLPIHQDGSCNGFQHYAAMGRDLQGAAEVNLIPADLPADIYSSVASRVEEKRLADEKSENEELRNLAQDLRQHLPDSMPRKVIKQTVMTTVYGVTRYGAVLQVKKQLKAMHIPSEKLGKFSAYVADRALESLTEAFQSSMAMKDWFRNCAAAAVQLMRPVEWKTPLGLPVMQPYLKAAKRHDHLCLIPKTTKQVNAFPPNFVHSLDSTHMMLTALHCRRRGLTFAAVHDCFWTHAADVAAMNTICREQFVALHESPVVEELAAHFQHTYLPRSFLNLLEPETANRMASQFSANNNTKGQLDLQVVKDSVYFFS